MAATEPTADAIEHDYHPLQDFLLPEDKTITELYLRILSPYVEVDDNALVMEKNAKVSFNTYFNSFYESYWVECTRLSDVVLELESSGTILVQVFRDTKNHGCHRINWKKLSSQEVIKNRIKLPLVRDGSLGEAGRLFVDITAEDDSRVNAMSFRTSQTPIHETQITLGICTFNRESFLYRNLKAILSFSHLIKSIEKIIVVNQGPVFANEDLSNLVNDSPLIRLIEQRNLGGCGGFTRTMHECLEYHDATHHVLMDDDAHVDARILRNLENFLAYASRDVVVGGHMLDLLRPWVLYEAGAIVKANSRIKPLHHNIDLRGLDSLAPFNACHFSDYNAWWFCAIPTEHIQEAQFPAPIFIRGDDMEYGVRLQEKGIKTVALPGVAVWHEPFYVKVGGWQLYYDLRNRLIMASVYPRRFSREPPEEILFLLVQALALHDYLQMNLYCKAVEDFLAGPVLFDVDAQVIHDDVLRLTREWSPESVANTTGLKRPKVRNLPRSAPGIAFLVLRRLLALMFALWADKRRPVLLMDREANLANVSARPYVKTNGLASYRLLYRPNRAKFFGLLMRSLRISYAYRKDGRKAADAWSANIGRLRSGEQWRQIFGTD